MHFGINAWMRTCILEPATADHAYDAAIRGAILHASGRLWEAGAPGGRTRCGENATRTADVAAAKRFQSRSRVLRGVEKERVSLAKNRPADGLATRHKECRAGRRERRGFAATRRLCRWAHLGASTVGGGPDCGSGPCAVRTRSAIALPSTGDGGPSRVAGRALAVWTEVSTAGVVMPGAATGCDLAG
jgi:hypothetical protein